MTNGGPPFHISCERGHRATPRMAVHWLTGKSTLYWITNTTSFSTKIFLTSLPGTHWPHSALLSLGEPTGRYPGAYTPFLLYFLGFLLLWKQMRTERHSPEFKAFPKEICFQLANNFGWNVSGFSMSYTAKISNFSTIKTLFLLSFQPTLNTNIRNKFQNQKREKQGLFPPPLINQHFL